MTHQQILWLVHKELQSLEVLRFNCGRRGIDGRGKINIKALGVICDTESPNSWCNCVGCQYNVYTPEERTGIRAAWEEHEWHGYQEQIRLILPLFPKLRLIEWVLGGRVRPFQGTPVPFWQWEISRVHTGGKGVKYKLKRSLHNWPHSNPLTEKIPWSPTRGMGTSMQF